MADSSPSLSPLRVSLQRVRRYLEVALQDDWGANAFEEVIRHVEPVLVDLESFGGQNESKRTRVSALGAQLEGSERAGILAWDTEVEREVKVLMPLLGAYLESLEVGGAA